MIEAINIHAHHKELNPRIYTIQSFHLDELKEAPRHPYSVGIHPWFIKNGTKQVTELRPHLEQTNLLALGEIGLDKLKGSGLDEQTQIFKTQITLSEAIKKPVVIHCVKAFNEILALRKELKPEQPWIYHGFNGNTTMALQLINAGFYISLGCSWLNKEQKFETLINRIPTHRIFLETDEFPSARIFDLYNLASKHITNIDAIIKKNYSDVFGTML